MKQLWAGPGLREGVRHNDEHIKVRSHPYLVSAAQLAANLNWPGSNETGPVTAPPDVAGGGFGQITALGLVW